MLWLWKCLNSKWNPAKGGGTVEVGRYLCAILNITCPQDLPHPEELEEVFNLPQHSPFCLFIHKFPPEGLPTVSQWWPPSVLELRRGRSRAEWISWGDTWSWQTFTVCSGIEPGGGKQRGCWLTTQIIPVWPRTAGRLKNGALRWVYIPSFSKSHHYSLHWSICPVCWNQPSTVTQQHKGTVEQNYQNVRYCQIQDR